MVTAALCCLKHRISSVQFFLWPLEADKELKIGGSTPFTVSSLLLLLHGSRYYHNHWYLYYQYHHTLELHCDCQLNYNSKFKNLKHIWIDLLSFFLFFFYLNASLDDFPHFPLLYICLFHPYQHHRASMHFICRRTSSGGTVTATTKMFWIKGSDAIIQSQGLISECWAWNRSPARRYSSAFPPVPGVGNDGLPGLSDLQLSATLMWRPNPFLIIQW